MSHVCFIEGEGDVTLTLPKEVLLGVLVDQLARVEEAAEMLSMDNVCPVVEDAAKDTHIRFAKLLLGVSDAVGEDILEGLGAGGTQISLKAVDAKHRSELEKLAAMESEDPLELAERSLKWLRDNHGSKDAETLKQMDVTERYLAEIVALV